MNINIQSANMPFWLKISLRLSKFPPPTRPWELRTRGYTIVGYCCMWGWRLDRIYALQSLVP